MKIILTGFMGSGKTTVGKLLSSITNAAFMDTDEEILKISSAATVAEIFSNYGEPHFRKLEHQVAEKISSLETDYIISTGGGMIIQEQNRELLRKGSKIVFLNTDFEIIKNRVEAEIKEKKTVRPLFSNLQDAKKLYTERHSVYQECSDCIVSTDSKTPAQVAEEILKLTGKE